MTRPIKHEPGGKRLLPLPADVRGSAVFGGERDEYRYTLVREWNKTLPKALFVMMNPSTAMPDADDPSCAKCLRYARAWGFGTLMVGNTFAYRVTDQKRLLELPDPVGPENDKYLTRMAKRAEMIVFAYGKPHKSLRERGLAVARMLSDHGKRTIHALQLCDDGTPSHPLYLRGDLEPVIWNPWTTT